MSLTVRFVRSAASAAIRTVDAELETLRTSCRSAIAVAIGAFALVVAVPTVEAGCATPSLIATSSGTGESFIWTEGIGFYPYYYSGYPPSMHSDVASPPVTPNIGGIFWKLGYGNPVFGLGDDSGSYDWVHGGGLYYSAYPPSYYTAASISTSWFPPGVDGCIGANACDCVLLTDQDGLRGYFAIASALTNGVGDTFLNQGGSDPVGNNLPIVLKPIPEPSVPGTNPDPAAGMLGVTVRVDSFSDGLYHLDGCNGCGPTGYKVLAQVLSVGSPAPPDRDVSSGWSELDAAGGGVQPVLAFDADNELESSCPFGAELWIATRLYFDRDFASTVVSASPSPLTCPCMDQDGDGKCASAGDCDDTDPNNWISCATCVDADGDDRYVGCDAYVTIAGPDCDDGNPTEPDADIDGVCDDVDNCPSVANSDQTDTDTDGVGEPCDNCPSDPNPLQEDDDGDGTGNACDPCPYDPDDDYDADGLCGDVDNCPSIFNSDQLDTELGPDVVTVWSLDEGSGTTVVDPTGGNDGTIYGAEYVTGISGSALEMAETSDYVIVSPVTAGFPSSEITVTFWINASDPVQRGTPFSYASTGSTNDFLIWDNQAFNIWVAGGVVTTTVSANDGAWHHIAVTWRNSDGQVAMYKDGLPVYEGALSVGATITGGGALVLGEEQDSVGGGFDPAQAFLGALDEVLVFDRALSAAEVRVLYGLPVGDGVGDVCDNCPGWFNPMQADHDSDTVGDACDLDDGRIHLLFDRLRQPLWHEETGYDSWNLYRGDLDELLLPPHICTQAPGSNALAARYCGLAGTYYEDLDPVAAGNAAFYLTTGVGTLGESDLGLDSTGIPRPNDNPCP